MTAFDLRPLSLGEILDRTFTLYRRNFLLFVGISAIPQLLVLAINLIQVMLTGRGPGAIKNVGVTIVIFVAVLILTIIAYLFSQASVVKPGLFRKKRRPYLAS